jgi:hypothetical protein
VNKPKPKAKRGSLHKKEIPLEDLYLARMWAVQGRIRLLEIQLREAKAFLADTTQALRQVLRERGATTVKLPDCGAILCAAAARKVSELKRHPPRLRGRIPS